jgi:8-oxo-dGTP diphosphatase
MPEQSVKTEIHSPGSVPDSKLTYVVMAATYYGEWIFVRHRDRTTWEMPAGHIEPGETPVQAAVRELFEEAGVFRSSLTHLCDYAVTAGERTEYGRLFKADVEEMTEVLEFETDEILLTGELPAELTYPDVQPALFRFAGQ